MLLCGPVRDGLMKGSLVYHGGALGDFITTLPACAAWRRLHPGSRIILLGKTEFAGLAGGLFDEVWSLDSSRFAALFGGGAPPQSPLGRLVSSIESALLFSPASSPLADNLSRLGVTTILSQEPFPASPMPVVDYHLSLFSGHSFSEEDRRPRVTTAPGLLPVSPRTAALHPGSGSSRKNWPLARFRGLGERLEAEGCDIAWIAGPAEEGLSLPSGSFLWRGAPLDELASALAESRLYVGNDSGITHLAASVGCPTVALFGATDPAVWAPRGLQVRIITSPNRDMEQLAEETVFEVCSFLLKR